MNSKLFLVQGCGRMSVHVVTVFKYARTKNEMGGWCVCLCCCILFHKSSVINVLSCVTQIFLFVCVCVYHRLGGAGGETLILGLWKEKGGGILILTVESRCSSVGTVCRASVCMDFNFKHFYGEYFQVWKLQITFRFWLKFKWSLSVNCHLSTSLSHWHLQEIHGHHSGFCWINDLRLLCSCSGQVSNCDIQDLSKVQNVSTKDLCPQNNSIATFQFFAL